MKKWMMAATSAALLATLAGCKSSSDEEDETMPGLPTGSAPGSQGVLSLH